MKPFILLSLALFFSCAIQAQHSTTVTSDNLHSQNKDDSDWIFVAETQKNAKWYIYKLPLPPTADGNLQCFVRTELPTDTVNNKIYQDVTKDYTVEFICDTKQFRFTTKVIYHNGVVLEDAKYTNGIFYTVVTESAMSEVLKAACKYYY